MRKRHRILLLAAVAAVLIVPMGYALSLERQPAVVYPASGPVVTNVAAESSSASVLIPSSVSVEQDADSPLRTVSPAGELVLVGTALFGLAALVRRSG